MNAIRIIMIAFITGALTFLNVPASASLIAYECEIVSNSGGDFSGIDKILWGYDDEDISVSNGWNGMYSYFIEFYKGDLLWSDWGGTCEWGDPVQIFFKDEKLDPMTEMVKAGTGYGPYAPFTLNDNEFEWELYHGWDDGSGIATDYLRGKYTAKLYPVYEPEAVFLLMVSFAGLIIAHKKKY